MSFFVLWVMATAALVMAVLCGVRVSRIEREWRDWPYEPDDEAEAGPKAEVEPGTGRVIVTKSARVDRPRCPWCGDYH